MIYDDCVLFIKRVMLQSTKREEEGVCYKASQASTRGGWAMLQRAKRERGKGYVTATQRANDP